MIQKYLQAALRKTVLSSKDILWAVKAIHGAMLSGDDPYFNSELINDWRNLRAQQDLNQIAKNANLSLVY